MSGILGQIESERPVDATAFARMLATLAARGPDGSATRTLRQGRVVLGQQRLALVDRTPLAAQPLANEDGTLWLTLDGAIHNFRELRKQLENAGHAFRSTDDAEVVLHAYEEWGDECVGRLRGAFAFGLWDDRRERLLLVRDRLGVKPLYYWLHAKGLVFASQPRALLAHPDFARSVDARAFEHYLVYGCVPGELAIWSGMSKLPAAHRLAFDRRGLRRERYWQLRYEPLVRRPSEAARLVRDKLAEVVRLQLPSEVASGILLSSGVEASATAAIATRSLNRPLASLSVGFEAEEQGELADARAASAFLATPLHEDRLSAASAHALVDELVAIHDEPGVSIASLRALAAARLARRHGVGVILCGDGANELFAGHPWYDGEGGSRFQSWRRERRRGAAARDLPASHLSRRSALGGLQGGLRGDAGASGDPTRWLRRFDQAQTPRTTRLQLMDLQARLVDDALLGIDHASAACGVDARMPLLDHELVETVFTIDERVRIAEGERKALLRRAAASWLPPEILSDGMRSSPAELGAWLAPPRAAVAAGGLADGVLVARGLLRPAGVAAALASGRGPAIWLLWLAERWARRWLEPAATS